MDDDPEFTTANALRDEQREPSAGSRFDITHPERSHSRARGMEYEGGTVFVFVPRRSDGLAEQVQELLDAGPYRYGDWFDLPMPLFLVHDDDTDDTFRLGVREERVELHVRSATSPAGVEAFHDRLTGRVGALDVRREQ
ncbi:hypothetical protein [Halosegnis rubeus]|uniref:hypothetical protein n=1 Tax=Halosegnis rubeus TaxID=2212850 RepID=UPI001CECBCDD|nr:hypothetical protein [Halosegnis rubeus]